MSSNELLDNINKAREYLDKALAAGNTIFENDIVEKMIPALVAIEETATDINYEAWRLRMEFLIQSGKLERLGEIVPSLMGTRMIPSV